MDQSFNAQTPKWLAGTAAGPLAACPSNPSHRGEQLPAWDGLMGSVRISKARLFCRGHTEPLLPAGNSTAPRRPGMLRRAA